MERRPSEEAYELYRPPAWREGYVAGRLQGLLVFRGVVSDFLRFNSQSPVLLCYIEPGMRREVFNFISR
jgi:hypothetical protein